MGKQQFTITPETRDRYITETLEFCDNVASQFIRQANLGCWRADLQATARLKLVEVIDRLAQTGRCLHNRTHFFAGLRISLRRRLIDASEEFNLIRTPRRRGKKKVGDPCVWLATSPDGACFATDDTSLKKLTNPTTHQELIGRCLDGIDRSLLVQALDGRTRKQIADDLRITQREVRNRCGRLLKAAPAEVVG